MNNSDVVVFTSNKSGNRIAFLKQNVKIIYEQIVTSTVQGITSITYGNNDLIYEVKESFDEVIKDVWK